MKKWAKAATAGCGAVLMAVSLGIVTASAATLPSRFATYQIPASSATGTVTLPAGYPTANISVTVGTLTTSSVDNLVNSPFKTFFTQGGTATTSSPHLSIQGGVTSSQTPNIITVTFERDIPAGHLGINLGDVDVETITIQMASSTSSGALTPLTPAQMGFQETYNSTTSGTDVPVKTSDDSANTITLTGTGSDTAGASAWFIPDTAIKEITLSSQITNFGRFYLWFAAIRPQATLTPTLTTYTALSDPVTAPLLALSFPAGIDANAFSAPLPDISYQVADAGDTGCTLTGSPQALTATAAGECRITATIAESADFIGTTTTFPITITKPVPVVEWVPEVTEFAVTEFPITVTPPPPPPSPSGEAYTFTKDPTTTSNCTVDPTTSTLTVPQPGTCVVTASTPETEDFAEFSITTTYTFTKAEPQLAATGTTTPAAWLMWAAGLAVMGAFLVGLNSRGLRAREKRN